MSGNMYILLAGLNISYRTSSIISGIMLVERKYLLTKDGICYVLLRSVCVI